MAETPDSANCLSSSMVWEKGVTQIGQSLIESKKIALGAFGRRLKAKRGPGIAVKATARKLAVFYWRLIVKGLDYTEKGIKPKIVNRTVF